MSKINNIYAPWTEDQVKLLERWQNVGFVHEYSCIKNTKRCGKLIPTVSGWICPYCDYRQNWFMDFPPEILDKDPFDGFRKEKK